MERLSAAHYQDRFSAAAPPEASPTTNGHEPPTPPVYDTGIGPLISNNSISKPHVQCGYVMREGLGMTNPQDVDDCMQSGYLKLWQKLQADPNWLADKPKSYIVQAVVLRSKAQRYSHLRHYRKIVYDARAPVGASQRPVITERVDIWMDIAQALHGVAQAVEDDPLMLLSLYTFITQAKATEVSQTFGVNYKTLAKRRPQTRALLASALAAYRPPGTHSENGHPVELPAQCAVPTPKISPWLLEDKPALWHDIAPAAAVLSSISDTLEPHYPTRWGKLSLEQILRDPQVRRAAFAKAARLGLNPADQEDCIQRGAIKLWQRLQKEPGLLADKGPQWVGIYLTYSGDPKAFQRQHARQQVFSDPDFDYETADEYLPLGQLSGHSPAHADWTTEVDESLDVQRFIDAMLQHYAAAPEKQIALQAVIGQLSYKEAAQRLGMDEKHFAATIGHQVRQEVQARLPDSMKAAHPESWQAQLARGEGVDHITAIAREVEHDPRLLLALYVVTTSASKKAVAETFGYGLTAFGQDIRKIKDMIAERYRRQRLQQN